MRTARSSKKMPNVRSPIVVLITKFTAMGVVVILLVLLIHVRLTFTDFRPFVLNVDSLPTAKSKDPTASPASSKSEELLRMPTDNHSQATIISQTTSKLVDDNAIIHKAFLQYSKDLQANKEQVEFYGNLTVTAIGEVCFAFALVAHKTPAACPFPSIRLRLSGAALVNVRLRRRPRRDEDASTTTRLDGCSLLPVSGTYHVDANLVHCLMNVNFQGRSRKFKSLSGKPVQPDLDVTFTPHRFVMPPFLRTNTTLRFRNQPAAVNAFSHHAWVFAPPCPDSRIYTISEHCTKLKSAPFIPTTFQLESWRQRQNYSSFVSPEFHRRFDDFMWLPVDSRNGSIDFPTDHLSHEYTPIPSAFQHSAKNGNYNKTILFVGASHMRFLGNQVSQIYYNITFGHDGCVNEHEPPPDLGNNQTRFGYLRLKFGKSWFKNLLFSEAADYYDKYVLTLGHWDAGYPRGRPTTPVEFLESLLLTIQILEDFAKPGAEIFVLSVNQHPMGNQMLDGEDWRVPPLIDAYNDIIWSQVEVDSPIIRQTSFRFRNFNRTYWLDNTDIMDPIWDSASDFYHPCRYGVRPMALRVLELLK
jgi:hypothetical protein